MRTARFHFLSPLVAMIIVVIGPAVVVAESAGNGEAISRAFTIENQLPSPPPQGEAISRAFTVINQLPPPPPQGEAISRAFTVINQLPPLPPQGEAISRAFTIDNQRPSPPPQGEAISRAFTVINLLPSLPPQGEAISRAFTVLNAGPPLCGDGLVTGMEECDDGDTVGGDGCSATCMQEPGWMCTGEPSICTPICDPPCVNGGTCKPLNTCNCLPGWTGPQCQNPDCNANGIPDEYDIRAGDSQDDDANGIPDECEAGGCCDESTGVCADDVPMALCTGDRRSWSVNTLCAELDPPCAGACCDILTGVCTENVPPSACSGAQQAWTGGAACADVACDAVTGACCDHDTFGACTDGVTQAACDCSTCEWLKLGFCSESDCPHTTIPTVSSWGLAILSLLLMTGAKIRFRRG